MTMLNHVIFHWFCKKSLDKDVSKCEVKLLKQGICPNFNRNKWFECDRGCRIKAQPHEMF